MNPNRKKLLLPCLSLGLILSLSYFILHNLSWPGNIDLRTSVDTLVAILAFYIAAMFLTQHYSKKSSLLLFIGLGFIGAGLIDSFNVVADLRIPPLSLKALPDKIVSWCSVMSLLYLSLMILLGLYADAPLTPKHQKLFARNKTVYLIAIGLALLTLVIFSYAPFPSHTLGGKIDHWTAEYAPSVVFTLCLLFCFRKERQAISGFHFWLATFLPINVIGQSLFMANAETVYDMDYQMAGVLKVISYLHILNYLLIDMFRNYHQTPIKSELRISRSGEMKVEASRQDEIKQGHPHSSKAETGQIEIEKINFNLKDLIFETCALIGMSAHEKGLEISVEIEDSVPRNITSDPAMIRQILLNLLDNAVKFTPLGKIDINVRKSRQSEACPQIRIEINDTGVGLTADQQATLFENFTQSETSPSRKYGSARSGLAIAKQLCRLLGGSIGVNSTAGKGSNFWFTLNYSPAEEQKSMLNIKNSARQHFNSKRSLKILVVDDNIINQTILENILQELEHKVAGAETGLGAIEAVKKDNFDLIVMDIHMPEMDGLTATRLIRRFPGPKSKIPIIACTADATRQRMKEYTRAGMNGLVNKPIDKAELLYVIDDCLKEDLHFPLVVKKDFIAEDAIYKQPKNNTELLENLLKEIGG